MATTKDNYFVKLLRIITILFFATLMFVSLSDVSYANCVTNPGECNACQYCYLPSSQCVDRPGCSLDNDDDSGGTGRCTPGACCSKTTICTATSSGPRCLGGTAARGCDPANSDSAGSGAGPANGESQGQCDDAGCGPDCGKGFRCRNGRCEIDNTCMGDVINVPYTGPRIDSLGALIGRIYNIMFPAALLIGVIMIIKAGYELMTSEGNPQLVRAGQEDMTAAVLGTMFVILSGVILRMIIVQILGGSVGF